MWFKKKRALNDRVPFPGTWDALDGHGAVWQVERIASQAIQVHNIPNTAQLVRQLQEVPDWDRVLVFKSTADSRILSGLTVGTALVGLRSVAFTSGVGLAEMQSSLDAAVGKRLSFVLHLTSRALGRHAETLWPGHDDYHALSRSGLFQLFAKNVQEAADFTLIAHRIAELALNPGLVAQDSFLTSHSIQPVRLPEPEAVRCFLGDPGDWIDCPTPAQKLLFGEKRRRIPEWFTIDRPLGIGIVQDRESFFRAVAGQQPYFWQHVAPIADQVFEEFARLTGRRYARIQTYRLEDADYVLVAQGSLVEELERLADVLRRRKKWKVGVLNVSMFRPFPGDRISHLLKGKKGVTVFERVEPALAQDPPLLGEIRAALDRAVENGRQKNATLPYPDYAVYQRPADRPLFYSAVYGVGCGNPAFEQLSAAVENMVDRDPPQRQYYLGVRFRQPNLRFPILERVQQMLDRDYPDREKWGLFATASVSETVRDEPRQSFLWLTVTGTGGTRVGGILARALFKGADWPIRTLPEYHLHQSIPCTKYFLERPLEASGSAPVDGGLQGLVVQDVSLVTAVDAPERLVQNGFLIVHWEGAPEALWFQLPERVRKSIQQRRLRLFVINARGVARDVASDDHLEGPLMNHALAGAFLQVAPQISSESRPAVLEAYRKELEAAYGRGPVLVHESQQAVQQGMAKVEAVEWTSLPPVEDVVLGEPPAPWTVRETRRFDASLFDLTHFWETVGFFYKTHREDQTLITPQLAIGTLPARSSAFRDFTPSRKTLPHWISERCTGCGWCWTLCPEGALPATVQNPAAMIETALQQTAAQGKPLLQLPRLKDNLAKLAYKLFLKDELHRYLTLGELLEDAFRRLLELMQPPDQQKSELEQEFQQFREGIRHLPIVRTQPFFDQPHAAQKGSGLLLTLGVNPDACKSCGLCTAVCPEQALEMLEQTDRDVARYRQNWRFLMELPDVPLATIAGFLREEAPETYGYLLLNRRVYHAVIGGDNAPPASGSKVALRLVAAAVESVMQARVEPLLRRIQTMMEQLEARVQGQVSRSLKINDFEQFAHKLSALEKRKVDLETLAALIQAENQAPPVVDKEPLERLATTLNTLKELKALYQQGAAGDGRARLAMAVDADSVAFWSGLYPYNPFPFPWVHHRCGEAPALAEGLVEGVTRKMLATFRTLRKARWILEDTYDPRTHDKELARLDWEHLTEEEKQLVPPVVVVGSEGTLGEAGLAGLSRILQRSLPIKIVVLDTQGYAATGGQPGAGGFASQGKDQGFRRQELALMALAFRQAFVLQGSIGYPGLLLKQLRRSLAFDGPALAVIYTPEPGAHGLLPEKVLEQARRAVLTRTFPIWTYDPSIPGEFQARIDLSANPEPERDWVQVTEMTRSGEKHGAEVTHYLTFAHWAVHEVRFRPQVKYLPQKEWHRDLVPLVEYLQKPLQEREGLEPYIEVVDEKGRLLRVVVSPQMVRDTEDRLQHWRLLQELAGLRSSRVDRIRQQLREELEQEFQQQRETLEREYRRRMAELDQKHEQIYRSRLTQRLLELSGYGRDAQKLKQTLQAFAERVRRNGRGDEKDSEA